MNILTIGKCLPYVAGPAVLALEEAKMFSRMGHAVHFVTYAHYPSGAIQGLRLEQLKETVGIRFHPVEVLEHSKVVGTATEIALLSKALKVTKANQIDFVNAHFAIPHGLVAVTLSRFLGVPSVVTLHGSDVWTLPHEEQFAQASQLVFDYANLLISVSESLKRDLFNLAGGEFRKVEVLGIGVNLNRFHPRKEGRITKAGRPHLLYVGRFAKVKRLDVLLAAFRVVKRGFPNASLTLVGVGDSPDLSETTGVTVVPGEFRGLPRFYQEADIFVLPSEQEGFPNSLCEAAAAGLPIVTTPVGSIPEIFKEGIHCLYAEVGNVDDLAKNIFLLAKDRDLAAEIGRNNTLLAKSQFDLQKRCQKLLELIQVRRRDEKAN